MFKTRFSTVLLFLLPVLAFIGGFRLTEFFFREKMIPYPFEWSGAAVGLALAAWSIGLVQLFRKK